MQVRRELFESCRSVAVEHFCTDRDAQEATLRKMKDGKTTIFFFSSSVLKSIHTSILGALIGSESVPRRLGALRT